MPDDPDTHLAHRPWPPAFAEGFVRETRSRLDEHHVLVIVGPVGASRDTLASDVAGMVDRPSRNRHVARQGEADRDRFVLDQLWRGDHLTVGGDLDDVETRIRQRLADHDQPPYIVLTDAELCDPHSIEVLVRLAESGDIRLIVTVGADVLPSLGRLRDAGDLLEVEPLDAATVAERLEARFDATPDDAVTQLVLARTGGSYDLVRRFADTALAAGIIQVAGGALRLASDDDAPPAPIGRPDEEPALADLFDVTALVGVLDADESRQLFGPSAVEAAVARGVLSHAGTDLGFVFPVEATSVRRSMPLERQVELFDRYAEALPRSTARPGVAPRTADWWASTGHLLPVDLAARATREANLQGRFRRALVYSDPASNEHQAPVAPIERAYALLELGETRDVVEIVTGIDPADLTEDELYAYLRTMRGVLDDEAECERLSNRAVSAVDDPATRRRHESVQTLADLVHETFVGSGEKVASRLRALTFSGQLSPGNRAVAFAALSATLRSSARPTQAVQASEFALTTLLDGHEPLRAFHLETTGEVLMSALVSALDLDGALHALDAYSSGPFGTGGGRLTLAFQAFVLMQRGSMREALASAQQFLNDLGPRDPHQVRGWVEAMAAECLVNLGRTDEAVAALGSAARHRSHMPEADLERRITMAFARDALAEPEEALEILDDVIDEATERGLLDTRIEAAGAAVLIGGPPQLGRLLDAVDDLVDPTGRPAAWQRFARGVRAYDIGAIVELAVDLEAKEARLMAAGVAQSVLDMARRATDLDDETRAHLTGLADLSGDLPD